MKVSMIFIIHHWHTSPETLSDSNCRKPLLSLIGITLQFMAS